VKGEVVEADEAGLVDNGTRVLAMPVMVGSGVVASRLRGMPRPPKLLYGLLEDRTWAMMPQKGGRSAKRGFPVCF
jgi:hypothetical protein